MSESLGRRVGRLIAGGFNAMVDAVENAAPESVMEQAIRELDTAIADVRRDLGQIVAQHHLAAKRLAEDTRRHEELGQQAEMALQQGREDLATVAVERQVDLEAQIPVLENRLSDLADERTRMEGFVNALQAKKREMQDALQSYRDSQRSVQMDTAHPAAQGTNHATRAEQASSAFDRVFSRQTGLTAGAGSRSLTDAASLAELEELSRKNRIQERLARMKAGNP